MAFGDVVNQQTGQQQPTNPILDELSRLSAGAKQTLLQAHTAAATQPPTGAPLAQGANPNPVVGANVTPPAGAPAPPALLSAPQTPAAAPQIAQGAAGAAGGLGNLSKVPTTLPTPGAPPPLPAPGLGTAPPPRGTVAGDEAYLQHLHATGPGENQIYSKLANSNLAKKEIPLPGGHGLSMKWPMRILGGLGQGAATLGDVAISAFNPAIAMNLPGTQYHHLAEVNHAQRQLAADTEANLKGAQTEEAQARAAAIGAPKYALSNFVGLHGEPVDFNPQSGALFYIDSETGKQTNTGIQHYEKPDFAAVPGVQSGGQSVVLNKNEGTEVTRLPVQPLAPDKAAQANDYIGPNKEPVSFDPRTSEYYYTDANGKRQTEGIQRYVNPNAGGVNLIVPGPNGSKLIRATPGTEIPNAAVTPSQFGQRSPVFDKAYVVPANAVEKSYEMMESLFDPKTGLPINSNTGAPGMAALSYHLSTTFGNVKGARITRDMIAQHLNARNISDDALVGMQKFTNGDPLSPKQWRAFNQLISESRRISWNIAIKEAQRKGIPIDFLPSGFVPTGAVGTINDPDDDNTPHYVDKDKHDLGRKQ